MDKNIKKLIQVIKTGSREEVKQSQKEVEKIWDKYDFKERNKRNKHFEIFLGELNEFDNILDIDHQCYFINVLKWPFLSLGEEYFEELSTFILMRIAHPSGKIRQSIINAASWFLMGLRMDLVFYPEREPTEDDNHRVAKNKLKFGRFVDRVRDLADKYHERKFNRIKYVSSLPVGEYKSIQKLLYEVLLPSPYFERIYANYQRKLDDDGSVKDPEIILPAIQLKYLKHELNGEKLTYPEMTCSNCGKKDISIGAGSRTISGEEFVICEDCAIDDYKTRFGFYSRQAAESRRRRIFDVGYLLQEMIIDQYLKQNKITDYEKLDIETMEFIGNMSRQLYNESFSRKEKWELENEPDQIKIENRLRAVLDLLT